MYPPSLPADLKARAFVATNGELGVIPNDAQMFLQSCRADSVEVLGWELWLVNHTWGSDNAPVASVGSWCGGIPCSDEEAPAVVCGTGDVEKTERQLAAFDFVAEVQPKWLPHVRVNFTLDS